MGKKKRLGWKEKMDDKLKKHFGCIFQKKRQNHFLPQRQKSKQKLSRLKMTEQTMKKKRRMRGKMKLKKKQKQKSKLTMPKKKRQLLIEKNSKLMWR